MLNALIKNLTQNNKTTRRRHKQGRQVGQQGWQVGQQGRQEGQQGRQLGQQGRQARSIDAPSLTANILAAGLTELTFTTRQAVLAFNQALNEMPVVKSIDIL